ncbi:phage tail spike protein [Weissella kandleri]|uniref:phage tail spike protein n=1 Tax=Weissella kandleri TaxID=1616 RepID=UPI00387EDE9B
MTPILYESTEIDFLNNGLGPLEEIQNVDIAEQRNGLFNLTATYPTTGSLYKEIEVGRIILVKPYPTGLLHAFRIVTSDLDVFGHSLQITADSITYDLTHNLIKHVVLQGNGQMVMSQLQNATVNPHMFTFSSDLQHEGKSELNNVNPMEAIAGTSGSVLQIWGGELKRENRKVSMLNRRGRDNVTSFRLGKNLSGLKYSVDMSSLVTQIIPYVTRTENGTENTEYIYGNVVNSNKIENYPGIYVQQVDVSQNITVSDKDTNVEIIDKINEYAKNWFTKSENTHKDEPKVTIDINVLSLQDSSDYQEKFKDLETVELTDTVTVYVPEFKINVTAVVNELHYDPLNERITSLVVGATKVSFADSNHNALDDMQNKIDEIHEDANNAIASANGKNTIYYGKEKPSHPVEGDLWYWTDGDNYGLKIYQNGEWVDVIDSKTQERIDQAVDEAINEANDYADNLNKVTNDNFNNTINDVNGQLESIQPRIDQARDDAIAHSDGKDVIIQQGIDNITEIVNDPETGLSSTRVQLSNAIQQEIKDRVTGDANTLTQSKDFTTSQIKSYDTGLQTQLTQTANGIIASVSAINQVVDSSLINQLEQWQSINQGGKHVDGKYYYSKGASYKGVPSIGYNQTTLNGEYSFMTSQRMDKIGNNNNATTFISVDLFVAKMGGTSTDYFVVYLHEYDKAGALIKSDNVIGTITNKQADNKWHNYRNKIALDVNTQFMNLTFQMRGNGNLYIARPYVGVTELSEGGYAPGPVSSNSTVLQLFNDNFALGIKNHSGDIISGINGDSSGTVISGKKIVLDGTVTVTGDFYAKGGNFKNLNASNMTAGTLNAANVNIINMNASSISTGTLTGVNINVNKTLTIATGGKVTWTSNSSYFSFSSDKKYWGGTPDGTAIIPIKESGTVTMNTSGNITMMGDLTAPNSSGPGYMWYHTDLGGKGSNKAYGRTIISEAGIQSSVFSSKSQVGKNVSNYLIMTPNVLAMGTNINKPTIGLYSDTGFVQAKRFEFSNDPSDATKSLQLSFYQMSGTTPSRFVIIDYANNPPKTSASANAVISSSGALFTSSSARRYKTDIQYTNDVDLGYSLMYMKPTSWLDKQELATEKAYWNGADDEDVVPKRYVGLIAENLLQAGLSEYVDVDAKTGQVQSIYYDRLVVALLPALADMNRRLVKQEEKNE